MSKHVRRIIAKIFRINSGIHKDISAGKQAREQREKILMMAMLSGSIRRVK